MDPKHGIQTKASGYRWKLWKYRVEDGQRGYESNGQKNNQQVLDVVENERGLMEIIEKRRLKITGSIIKEVLRQRQLHGIVLEIRSGRRQCLYGGTAKAGQQPSCSSFVGW